ncbi:MAG: Stp1/IreP family PP2C-type Ser/Thr phosphatase [Myxococcales bacterium]|nr:MAG: Stp1/IreP family PP2C-type Ser/Thr phosphatase [Myxococcales bacterium]
MKALSAATSDVGRVRAHNEDSFLENASLGLYAVADGMGGHKAGEVASRMALDVFSSELAHFRMLIETCAHGPTPSLRRQIMERMDQAMQKASAAVFSVGQSDPERKGMGTTLSALLLVGRSAFIAHVGDTRVYLLRDNQVHKLTEDHTLVAEQRKKGLLTAEEAARFPYKNVVTRGVGLFESVPVDTLHLEIAPADKFLLCSDGLHECLSEEEIPAMFDAASLEDVTRRLVELANLHGGRDNITALAVEVPDLPMSEGEIAVHQKLETLRQIALFRKLSYSELIKTLNAAQILHHQKGDMIIREGERGDRLYIILSGAVDILKDNVYLTTLERGGHFGEMALIENSVRSATVRAAKPCDLLAVEQSEFYRLLGEEPHLAVKILLNFVGVLSERLRETTRAFSESRRRITEINISG